ncbi:Uncharacterised protein [Propionibacterium australiense]|uniref:Uncharacterized protein n=1 Tax=Propionibacterium australiense TaxID=119981 RepID=A0A383S8H2_9ACTN|nr:Hypothetical protein PROPAUS_1599 [Propionibacterium australiense]VEH92945.1 Uncharacterised protein [Propionibacterium australiense]
MWDFPRGKYSVRITSSTFGATSTGASLGVMPDDPEIQESPDE